MFDWTNIWLRLVGALVGSVLIVAIPLIVQNVLRLARLVRNVRPYLEKYPDEAYELLMKEPEKWMIFNGIPPESVENELPRVNSLPRKKALGPFMFRVPKLHNCMITTYGISPDCGWALTQFVSQMREKEEPGLVPGTGMVNKPVSSLLDEPPVQREPEMKCLQCQTLIEEEQTQCPQCGWSWIEEAKKEGQAKPIHPQSIQTDLNQDLDVRQ